MQQPLNKMSIVNILLVVLCAGSLIIVDADKGNP